MKQSKTCPHCGAKISESDWVKIPELKIEVQKEIHHKDQTLANALKDLKKGERIPTYAELQWLRNSDKYREMLNLVDTWEFVKQEDKLSKNNNYVARFYANSDGAVLDCYRDPVSANASLGVRFVREMK